MKSKFKNINYIVKSKLCLGCGTCDSVCPSDAIAMIYSSKNRTYIPVVDKTKCTNCTLCYQVCPSIKVTLPKFKSLTSNTPGKKISPEFGEYFKCYVGYANDKQIRYEASSGGIATALSMFLLESKSVDGVVGIKMKDDSPFDTEAQFIRDKNEVKKIMGSKYCPAATNSIIKKLNKSDVKSVLFTGLPCHIQGINNMRKLKPLKEIRDIITIGLLCGGVKGKEGTEWILKKRDIPNKEVKNIIYRSKGWPGSMTLDLQNNDNSLHIPLAEYYDEVFESWRPWRCFLCLDRSAEVADITLGDAWLPELKSDLIGSSIIIVRSEKGMQVIEKAIAEKVISVKEVDESDIKRSQIGLWEDINYNVNSSLFLTKILCRKMPHYDIKIQNPGWSRIIKRIKSIVKLAVLRKVSRSKYFYYIDKKFHLFT